MLNNQIVHSTTSGGGGGGTTGYQVDNSARFNHPDRPRLFRTMAVGTDGRTQTIGGWFKLANLTVGDRRLITVGNYTDGVIEVTFRGAASFLHMMQVTVYKGGDAAADPNTIQLFRDPHAWYHLCISYDTNRSNPIFKVFLNNEEITGWDDGADAFFSGMHAGDIETDDTFSLNAGTNKITLGANFAGTGSNFDGYMSQWFCLDGTAVNDTDVLTPADLGIIEVDANGIVRPADLTGLGFGDEGWLLDFASPGALGNDASNNPSGATAPLEADYTFVVDAFTFSDSGNITATDNNRGVFLNTAISGDFQFEYTIDATSGVSIGFIDAANIGTFETNAMTGQGGQAALNSWILESSGTTQSRFTRGTGAEPNVAPSSFLGDIDATWTWTRVGGVISIAKNGSTVYTYPETDNTEDLHFFVSAGGEFDVNDILYLTGEGEEFGNSFTTSGLEANDQVPDSPSNNWATLSSVSGIMGTGAVNLSNGNLDTAGTVSASSNNTICSHTVTSGKWIWAVKPGSPGQAQNSDPWIFDLSSGRDIYVNQPNLDEAGWGSSFDTFNDFVVYHGTETRTTVASSAFAADDLQLVAADIDNLKIWFGYYDDSANTTNWMDGSTGITGNPEAGTNQTFTLTGTRFAFGTSSHSTRTAEVDFGQRTGIIDKITIPEGFEFLNTANLAEPTIADGSAHFGTLTYGGGATDVTFTGIDNSSTSNSGFMPDMTIIKVRTGASNGANIWDSVRGNTKSLHTIDTGVEDTDANSTVNFATDGLLFDGDASPGDVNTSGRTYVAWNWLAGNTSTGGILNEAGDIDTMVSVNNTAGFSIGTYTANGNGAATLGHGLTVGTPEFVIFRRRTPGQDWHVGYIANGVPGGTELNNDTGATTANVTSFTSDNNTTISITGGGLTNDNNDPYVFYTWTGVSGFSSFGTYKGNGDVDGTMVTLDFLPAFITIKRIEGTGDWQSFTNSIPGYNVTPNRLALNGNFPEATSSSNQIDFGSNFFKIRSSHANMNANNTTYIYAAWAKNPFGGSNVSPATAR